jgi:uncharacterized protein (DUF2147 family)
MIFWPITLSIFNKAKNMNLRHIVTLFALMISTSAMSQTSPADKVLGVWLSEEKDGKIEIYKTGDTYSGKILEGRNLLENDGKTLRKDTRNPDAKLRSRALLNLVILTGFKYQDEEWTGGKIYDPKSGKTYSSTIKLKKDKLELRGFVGFSLLGRTTVWERVK